MQFCSNRPAVSAQPKPRVAVIEAMLQYVHTDAACCRHEPGALADRQAQARTCSSATHLSHLQARRCHNKSCKVASASIELSSCSSSSHFGLDCMPFVRPWGWRSHVLPCAS